MTARQKIETLTNSWYGFAVFSAVTAFLAQLREGFSLWSSAGTVAWMLLSWGVIWFLGRRLLAKSSLTRALLLLISGIATLVGTVAFGRGAWHFITSWELSLLSTLGYSAISAWMNLKSFRTLTDSSVRAYFN